MSVLSKTYAHSEATAFRHLETVLWPQASICPHCGSVNAKHYDLGKTCLGLRNCAEKGCCRKQLTVKVGTVFEQAHIPLNKCLLALYLMCASKKGISAHQLHRTLEIGYKAAWFLCRRIRDAMRDGVALSTIIGGSNQVVEADETYIGGKAKNRAHHKPAKKAVRPLVERDGRVRSFHLANVTAKSVKPLITTNADEASMLMTEESAIYTRLSQEVVCHATVNQTANNDARLGGISEINASENFCSIVKRCFVGFQHSMSEAHLHRYLAEFDFRYDNRSGLGCEDSDRAFRALTGVVRKCLEYQPPDEPCRF